MTTTDPAEQIREWNRQHGGGYLDEDLFDAALTAAYQRGRDEAAAIVERQEVAAYQRGRDEAVERIRAALDRNEGYGVSGHLTRTAIDAILDAQADR